MASGVLPQSRRAPSVALGRRASLLVSAGVIAHTLWTSAAPAMVCRLYADEWHLSHTVTTGIFAIYPVVVALTLICFGDISDHIGRRATMLVGLRNATPGLKDRAIAGPRDYEQIPALVDRSKLRVANFLPDLDTRPADSPFVAGDRVSVADITSLATMEFAARAFGITIPEKHQALTRWHEKVSTCSSASA